MKLDRKGFWKCGNENGVEKKEIWGVREKQNEKEMWKENGRSEKLC